MGDSVELVLKYPAVLPLGPTEFRGFVSVNGADHPVRLQENNSRWRVLPDPRLDSHLQGAALEAGSALQLLDELVAVLSAKARPAKLENFADGYGHILSEYVELRDFYISMRKCSVSEDLREIRITHADAAGRAHRLVVSADCSAAADMFRVVQHELPLKEGLFSPQNSLKGLYERFTGAVDMLQRYFDVMDAVDASCWVLDPEEPSRKDSYRRINLGSNVSVVLTIDPWRDCSIPSVKFLGPGRLVDEYSKTMAENQVNWDAQGDFVQELLKLLGISSFPRPPEDLQRNDLVLYEEGECCICFSNRLNDKLPEIICPNPCCEQFFHQECLYQWLISVAAKRHFDKLHGQCPNCEKVISCPI